MRLVVLCAIAVVSFSCYSQSLTHSFEQDSTHHFDPVGLELCERIVECEICEENQDDVPKLAYLSSGLIFTLPRHLTLIETLSPSARNFQYGTPQSRAPPLAS